jgi:hypothetical protein
VANSTWSPVTAAAAGDAGEAVGAVGDAGGGVGEVGWDAGGVTVAADVPLSSPGLGDGERGAESDGDGDEAPAAIGEAPCAPLAPPGTQYSTVKLLVAKAELPASGVDQSQPRLSSKMTSQLILTRCVTGSWMQYALAPSAYPMKALGLPRSSSLRS